MAKWEVPALIFEILAADSGRAEPPGAKLDYNFQVRPILADRCFVCHGPDEKKRQADLRLDQAESAYAGDVIAPGHPEKSLVIQRITADGKKRMPPEKSKLRLSKEEIATIRRWIAEGAEYKPHWALTPPADKVPLPAGPESHPPGAPLDHFILSRPR